MRRLLPFALLLLLAACTPSPAPSPAGTEPAPMAAADPVVEELGVADAQARMASGETSSEALTRAYLARIDAIDREGPALRAVIETNPAAIDEARALDAERAAGKLRGPLHGIPVLLKDNIDAVGMANSAGSLALAANRPGDDAFLVTRLRDAGAVILGKTNLSEWANFRSTRSSSGWSSRGGQTRNPYVLDRNPCGSSAGTGSAIAASLATVGVGTETDGSIICPSAVNGLVGLKPTVGVVSRDGIIPISISQDTAGPMGRTVADVAALMNALAGIDEQDPASHAAAGNLPVDYTAALDAGALAGKRLGVLRQAMGYHPGVDANVEASIAALRAAGAEVVDVRIDTLGQWGADELEVLLYEFKDGLNAYLAGRDGVPGSLEALIAWNDAHADEAMPWFGQELFLQAQAKGGLDSADYLAARDRIRRLAGAEGLLKALDGAQLDAIIAPSTSPAWPTDWINGDHFSGAGYGSAAVAGTPSLTVPSGEVQGLPIGLVFMGRPYSEPELLALGHAFEQATKARKPPRYLPTLAP
ncbi:MAG TPA: amidase [Arenimonas sp.]|uniref:amidase n=1 Tax=Arenimonas sp. TaxID=1872635 RepID=UPI002D7F3081|nr:amidase [Arenimonas sp.]HEU0152780.1 amidase [Arenimonas sp.]